MDEAHNGEQEIRQGPSRDSPMTALGMEVRQTGLRHHNSTHPEIEAKPGLYGGEPGDGVIEDILFSQKARDGSQGE